MASRKDRSIDFDQIRHIRHSSFVSIGGIKREKKENAKEMAVAE